jgi:predicted DNA-binding transcriptional regulator AlpA
MADDGDAGKWARARAIAAEEAALQEQYEEYKRTQALDSRFRDAGAADVIHMFETGTNEKGEPLSQFEFEALCERWCAVFGELPPFGPPDETPAAEPDPLPPDDAMLAMRDVIRITGMSKSTIKRWVNDPASTFPKPVKISKRAIRWPADQVKAWRKRLEETASGRKH